MTETPTQPAGDALVFTVAKRRKEAIEFWLAPAGDDAIPDGPYHFTAPKTAALVLPVVESGGNEALAMKALLDWLSKGMPDTEVEKVWARLNDADDDLDVDTLTQVVQGLAQRVGGERPTT